MLEADPSGKIVWEWRRPDHHHDASQLRNGNAIVLGLEKLPAEFSAKLRGGQPNSEFEGASYGDVIYEVDRKGEIVWTWRAQDHVRPEDAVIHAQDTREHWPMGNSVNELSDGNILVSFRNVSKVAIISRKTGEVLFSLDHPVGMLSDRDMQLWIDWLGREGDLDTARVGRLDSIYTNEFNPYRSQAAASVVDSQLR